MTDLGKKLFEIEITETTVDTLIVEFNYCALVNAWVKQNLDDETIVTLCDMVMDADRELGKTIVKGDDICQLCFTKKK